MSSGIAWNKKTRACFNFLQSDSSLNTLHSFDRLPYVLCIHNWRDFDCPHQIICWGQNQNLIRHRTSFFDYWHPILPFNNINIVHQACFENTFPLIKKTRPWLYLQSSVTLNKETNQSTCFDVFLSVYHAPSVSLSLSLEQARSREIRTGFVLL